MGNTVYDNSDVLKEHLPISEVAVELLRKSIIEGHLAPGTKISVRELAESWGISRTPIREAIKRLESEGLLVSIPRKGAVVRKFTPREIRDIYTVRLALELLAVRLAIPNLQDKRIEEIELIHRNLVDALGTTKEMNVSEIIRLNDDFHFSIYKASSNEILCDIIRNLWNRISPIIVVIITSPERGKHMISEHSLILEALRERDSEKAAKALQSHMESTQRILLRYYAKV